jgi:hypothetical protein
MQFNFSAQFKSLLLITASLTPFASLLATTTAFRLQEGLSYSQETPFNVRPHSQTEALFPSSIVSGNPSQTSANLWSSLLTSGYLLGGNGSSTRGRDFLTDWDINFYAPGNTTTVYWGDWYTDRPTWTRTNSSYPLTLANGPLAGQSLIGNTKLIGMGDNNTLWFDSTTGKLNIYNFDGGTLEQTLNNTTFTGGSYNGLSLSSQLASSFIGYEQSQFYFLEGSNKVNIYNYSLAFVRQDTLNLSGLLAGKNLAQLIDGQIAGYTYLGWDLGPVVLAIDDPRSIPEPSACLISLSGMLLLFRRKRR